eukprot:Gb_00130 [translate_table: standard]
MNRQIKQPHACAFSYTRCHNDTELSGFASKYSDQIRTHPSNSLLPVDFEFTTVDDHATLKTAPGVWRALEMEGWEGSRRWTEAISVQSTAV